VFVVAFGSLALGVSYPLVDTQNATLGRFQIGLGLPSLIVAIGTGIVGYGILRASTKMQALPTAPT
jgi:hypothetical protein